MFGFEWLLKKVFMFFFEIEGNVIFYEKIFIFFIVEFVVYEGDFYDLFCDGNLGFVVGEVGMDLKFKKLYFKVFKVLFFFIKIFKDSLVLGVKFSIGFFMIFLLFLECLSFEL